MEDDATQIIESPHFVNTQLVEQTMDLVGYTKRHHYVVIAASVINVAFAFLACLMFVPLIGTTLSVGVVLSGALLVYFLWAECRDFSEDTLTLRNALERHLGLPEHARHRRTYSCCDCSLDAMGQR